MRHSRHVDRQPYLAMEDRPEQGPSYVVFVDLTHKDGDIYKAVNGSTGLGQFSNSELVIVLDYCRRQLPLGGSIQLKAGFYELDISFNMSVANMVLKGEGKRTIIEYNGPNQAINVSANHVTVKDMKIVVRDGAGNAGTRPNIIYAASVENLQLMNLWLIGDASVASDGSNALQNGIYLNAVAYSEIVLCHIEACRRNGISLSGCFNLTVSMNTPLGNYQNGLYAAECTESVFSLNTCRGNFAYGLSLYGDSDRNTVVGNVIQDNRFSGLSLISCSYNTVIGNVVYDNAQYGINLLNAFSNVISGNIVSTNEMDGIGLNLSESNIISNNRCLSNVGYGIVVTGDSDYNKVSGNYTSGNTVGSINVAINTCDATQIEWNTVEEGAPVDAGTNTRSYGNYDPSANAFVGDVGAAPF